MRSVPSGRTASCSRGTWRTTARSSGASAWISGRRNGTRCPRTSASRPCAAEPSIPGLAATLFPVRALPAHRQLAAGHPAREPAGPLERRAEPGLGEQVHDQHQHRDELLAGGGDEPRGVPRAALRPDRGAARAGPPDGAGALRRARLRRPSQHRPLARGDPRRRRPLGPVADGRRVALDAPLRALRLRRRPGVPAQGLPGA